MAGDTGGITKLVVAKCGKYLGACTINGEVKVRTHDKPDLMLACMCCLLSCDASMALWRQTLVCNCLFVPRCFHAFLGILCVPTSWKPIEESRLNYTLNQEREKIHRQAGKQGEEI